jgi:alpha-tubulin suppressor-like RCC1 family protein
MSLRYTGAWLQNGAFDPLASPPPIFSYGVWSWGQNNSGQLGLNNDINYSSPKQVGSLTNWLSLSCGFYHVTSIKTDGTLWSWGRNSNGQLGLGNTTIYSSPKQVGSLTNWLNLGNGQSFATAIKKDGTLWAWGDNNSGQLGLNNTTNYSSPVQVGSLTNWLKTEGGNNFTLGIKTDGTLWSWGQNNDGQLGLSNATDYSSPKQVGSLTDWSKIATSGARACFAIKINGTLWSWGRNSSGQLGLGNRTYYSSPKQIGALTNWAQIATAGDSFTLAVKTDGTLWSWGRGASGYLGLGNTTNYSSPKQVGSLTNWLYVACGSYSSFSIKTNGTLWSWGANGSGQLGLGNRTAYSSPKQVGSLTNWSFIGGGGRFQTAALQL